MPYIPNSDEDRRRMLAEIGVPDLEALLQGIPPDNRVQGELPLPAPLSESELTRHIHELCDRNFTLPPERCLLGGGAYLSHITDTARSLALRSEFITAYTPYQAEVSQGTLQVIYEFQSLICRLTGMEIANASLYDGGTAIAEAIHMAEAIRPKGRVLLSEGLFRKHSELARTYATPAGRELAEVPVKDGRLDLEALEKALEQETCAFVIQSPNAYGSIEDLERICGLCHAQDVLVIHSFDPLAQALFLSSGEADVDIAVGEGQSIAQPIQYGGPNLGLFASRKQWVRQMPGRLIGSTEDSEGRRGYALTFQTREQHIRRGKATSNICTNQALVATFATIGLSLLGRQGLKDLAGGLYTRANWLAERLEGIEGVELFSRRPFFREFAIRLPRRNEVVAALKGKGWLAGTQLDEKRLPEGLLLSVNEYQRREDLEAFAGDLETCLREALA